MILRDICFVLSLYRYNLFFVLSVGVLAFHSVVASSCSIPVLIPIRIDSP